MDEVDNDFDNNGDSISEGSSMNDSDNEDLCNEDLYYNR